jgi:quercetin dioxygenase-like cupin family protein
MDSERIAEIKHSLKTEGYNIYVYSYPGGMFFPLHNHDHDTIHVVLSGSLKITVDGIDEILDPGERFVIPALVPHSSEVLGDSPVVCMDATKPRAK